MASRAPVFPAHHPGDRTFFLGFLVFAWIGVLLGFLPPLAGRLAGRADYIAPLILHIHAASFVGWMGLLTAQILLIRTRRTPTHRRLGALGALLIPIMVLSGFFAEGYSQRFYLTHPPDSQAFFIIPIYYVIAFGLLATTALAQRSDPPAHKRLIFLATSVIVGAAYTRVWGRALTELVGDGFWGLMVNTFTGTHLFLLAALAYDWWSRKQIHPVLLIAVPAILASELVVSWIYHAPGWLPVARAIASALPGPPI